MSQVLGSGWPWIQGASSPNNQVLLCRRVDSASRFSEVLVLDSPLGWGPLVDQLLGYSENFFICSIFYSPTRMKKSTVLLSDDRNCLMGVMHRWWLGGSSCWGRKYFLSVSQLNVHDILDVQSQQLRQRGCSIFLWKWFFFLICDFKKRYTSSTSSFYIFIRFM